MLAGEPLHLEASAYIEMNWSYKYDRETMVDLPTLAGMQSVAQYLSTDERFLAILASIAR
ncbi:MAG TPA: hypothetical protein EYQ20_15655 [candidate division Zixibacteria bacterium]|nr:hypothetical protein [candidate division Zixibacteria bacterium]